MSKQKIKRVSVVSPVNPPGKFDKNLRHFEAGEWAFEQDALGVMVTDERGQQLRVPMSNIASIDYERGE